MSQHSARGRPYRRRRLEVLSASSRCWICGLLGADSIDHVVPSSVAPELRNSVENMRPAHRVCNSKRGAGRTVARGRAVGDWYGGK